MYLSFKRDVTSEYYLAIFFKVSFLLLAQFILLSTYLSAQTAPTITTFSPTSAKLGNAVIITGTNFDITVQA